MLGQLGVSPLVAMPTSEEWLGFRCTLRASDGHTAWIRVVGELDLATSPQLEAVLREATVRGRRIVLDLRALTFIDCAAAAVIVRSSHHARQMEARLVLVRGPAQVDRLFALTGSADGLEIIDLEPFQPPVQALVKLAHRDAAIA
jgi:anti-sigma B factor antagonist